MLCALRSPSSIGHRAAITKLLSAACTRLLSRIAVPPLPYPTNALTPHISQETLEYHHGKHVTAYVAKVREMTEGVPELAKMTIEDLIMTQSGTLFNQAAQVWNHDFYFKSMKPMETGALCEPPKSLKNAIAVSFGSVENFRDQFTKTAMTKFGSGWVWLVLSPTLGPEGIPQLKIVATADAMTPLRDGSGFPLLVCDVWEHAYYIDYRNAKANYLSSWWKVVNWELVEDRYKEALKLFGPI